MVGSPNPALDQIRHVFKAICFGRLGLISRIARGCCFLAPRLGPEAGSGHRWRHPPPPLGMTLALEYSKQTG